MEKSVLLYQLVELIIFCIPVGTLVWKAAKQSGRIEELEESFKKLETEVNTQKVDTNKAINEMKDVLNQLNISFAKIETSLSFIEKSIKKEGN